MSRLWEHAKKNRVCSIFMRANSCLDIVTGAKGVWWQEGFAEARVYLPDWRLWLHVVVRNFELLPEE